MSDVNPYASPTVSAEAYVARSSSTMRAPNLFIIAAEAAFLSLLFAPSQPHPAPYTATERLLATVTSSWILVIVYIFSIAALVTTVFVALRIIGARILADGEQSRP